MLIKIASSLGPNVATNHPTTMLPNSSSSGHLIGSNVINSAFSNYNLDSLLPNDTVSSTQSVNWDHMKNRLFVSGDWVGPRWWWEEIPGMDSLNRSGTLLGQNIPSECGPMLKIVNFVDNYYLIPYFVFTFIAILMIFMGFKHIRASNFFIPAIYTATISFVVFHFHLQSLVLLYRALSAAGIGLLTAILSCGVIIIGNTLIYFFSGAILGLFLTFAIRFAVSFPYIWIGGAILSGCGMISVIGGSFNSQIYRVFALFNCCSFIIFATIDYVLNDCILTKFAFQVMTSSIITDPPCWSSWLYLISWVVPIIFGFIFMAVYTAVENNRSNFHSKHKSNVKYFQNLVGETRDSKIL